MLVKYVMANRVNEKGLNETEEEVLNKFPAIEVRQGKCDFCHQGSECSQLLEYGKMYTIAGMYKVSNKVSNNLIFFLECQREVLFTRIGGDGNLIILMILYSPLHHRGQNSALLLYALCT